MGIGRPQKSSNGVPTRWVSLFCIASFFLGILVVNRMENLTWFFLSLGIHVKDGTFYCSGLLGLQNFKLRLLTRFRGFMCFLHWLTSSAIPLNDFEMLGVKGELVSHRGDEFPANAKLLERYRLHIGGGNQFWDFPDPAKMDEEASSVKKDQLNVDHPTETAVRAGDILSQVSQTHDVIMTLDKTISSLEMQLASARAAKVINEDGSPMVTKSETEHLKERPKFLFVMGIMTAFSSRKRRDSIRQTWMPKGEELKKLETEKGIIIRFVIGHSASPGGVLDRATEAEDDQHKDFLRLNHVEGMVGSTLARHRSKPRVYMGCMKSGPVLAQSGVKYHEPEYWKFGEEGNKYFRHATGQIYAISKDLATYISVNRHVLHRYANEDVSLGSWFIGLDVEHVDDRSLCCGTAPDCEWKAQAGNPCAASFDWSCSGICKSVERMEEVHQRCGEGDEAIWHTSF
ncbi:hypothetical protein DKX38_026148 [Salix brachista]|uniref:Hexosyltransferase n=1 Tax=Salix brachista TaxID=2182728 RepID=A0A5N5JRE7_9ROSI|nr:hypothetical protein DKX38_026148 [Salix brachista]